MRDGYRPRLAGTSIDRARPSTSVTSAARYFGSAFELTPSTVMPLACPGHPVQGVGLYGSSGSSAANGGPSKGGRVRRAEPALRSVYAARGFASHMHVAEPYLFL